jgi:CRP/FNR family cyclic AMP-dependent transcriptional regulator
MVAGCPTRWWIATIAVRAKGRDAGRVTVAERTRALPYAEPSPFAGHRAPQTVHVVDEDPGLIGALTSDLAQAARCQLVARTLRRDPGRWAPLGTDLPLSFDGWIGMLVLDGLLVRQLDVGGLRCCELLGPGDLLRPWDEDDPGATLQSSARWRVLEPTRLALLDPVFAHRACRWPTVTAELAHRSIRRSRALSVLLSLTQARRADVRLRTLFLHLADRWGRVTPDGIVVPLRLTHTVIAELTGLRRPSVSISLAELEREGEIVRLSKGAWLLSSSGRDGRPA